MTNQEIKTLQTDKGRQLAAVGPVAQEKRGRFSFEIVAQKAIDTGVEVFVKAWHEDGSPVGFGIDGSVEIERFRIFNPPVLVPAPNGDIIRKSEIDFVNEKGDTEIRVLESRFRKDPKEALMQIIAHSLEVKKQIHKDSAIVKDKIGNTTDTFYPAGGANSPCDGYSQAVADSWDGAHDATSASSQRVTVADEVLRMRKDSGGNFYITRMVFNFDTSSIDDTDTITSATVSFSSAYGYVWGQDNNTDPRVYIGLVNNVGLAAYNNLASGDFDNIGDAIDNPTLGSDTKPWYSAWATTGTYVDFPMNASGIGWISKTGITSLGLREGHDIEDVAIPIVENNYVIFSMSESDGSSIDPKLVVEHSAGASSAIKTFNGVTKANTKTVKSLAIASVKTWNGFA